MNNLRNVAFALLEKDRNEQIIHGIAPLLKEARSAVAKVKKLLKIVEY